MRLGVWRWFGAVLGAMTLATAGPSLIRPLMVGEPAAVWAADATSKTKDSAQGDPAGSARSGKNDASKASEDASKRLDAAVNEKTEIASTENEAPAGQESFLGWLYRSLGLRYVVIFLFLTFNGVALAVMIVLGLRRDQICPDLLAAEFEAKLSDKQYQEAYELAKNDPSVLGKVLAAGMAKLSEGYAAATDAMQEVGEEQSMKLEQRNGYIALIAQIGPMFGLLGTVDGMVQAFDVIAHSNVTPKPSALAQGIGTALVTTVVGLSIAIPCIAFYHVMRNRLTSLMLETGVTSGNLMKRFSAVQPSAKKGG
ncbi:MAG: MotA/TolQ/ExbB proton channel family protein [Planctomycetaceae bacterium]|nr:MotA/TolQ/ExbB proton channel family protein [Planctomycetaceae bacterium]